MKKEELIEKWESLESRERIMLSVGGVALSIMLAYALIWDPLATSIYSLENEVSLQKSRAQEMHSMADDFKTWRPSEATSKNNSNSGGTALVTLVDQTARKSNINVQQWQPDGVHKVKVRLDSVSFDQLMKWLAVLHQKHAVNANIAVINKGKEDGKVDARITLEEAAS